MKTLVGFARALERAAQATLGRGEQSGPHEGSKRHGERMVSGILSPVHPASDERDWNASHGNVMLGRVLVRSLTQAEG